MGECPRGVMAKAMDCEIEACKVRTPVALLLSLSDKYPWKRYDSPYLTIYSWEKYEPSYLTSYSWERYEPPYPTSYSWERYEPSYLTSYSWESYEPPLSFQLWIKQCHYCSSIRMAFELNNLQRLVHHYKKTFFRKSLS